jgi:5-formyltetrahydrofolate cyclo-ligase
VPVTKSELRKLYLEKRNALSLEEVTEMSESIAERFFTSFNLADVSSVHCFISIPKFNEIDTSIIFERLWIDFPHIRTVVPRVDRHADVLEHLAFTRETMLTESSWGIREPAGEGRADPLEISLVLVPLLCFDKHGHRVGYGKGYYDRFLSECQPGCLKIGLGFFGPVDEISDTHAGDVRLDYAVTPAELFRFITDDSDRAETQRHILPSETPG